MCEYLKQQYDNIVQKDTNKKSIAFITENFTDISFGGELVINYNLINHLKELGYKVDVYCQQNGSYSNNIAVFDSFISNKENYIAKINKQTYDLIIASRFGLKFPEIRADIYTIHSHSDLYSQKAKFGFWYNIIKPKQKRIKNEIRCLKNNKDAIYIFCSNQLKNDYCSLCNLDKTFIINPYPNCTPQTTIKNNNDVFTFGISATGFQNKGGYLILKSAFLLKLAGKKFKLKIIYKKKVGILKNLIVTLLGLKNNVEFLPKQNDMHQFYESIDCLCMPSQLESFGMVSVEAMAFGIPVIVSSTSGITEIIQNNSNGFVFEFNNNKVWNLCRQMKNIMEHKDITNIKRDISRTKLMSMDEYHKIFSTVINKVEEKCF